MESTHNDLRLYTRNQAAKILGIGKELLNKIIDSGKLRFIQLGKRIRIPEVALKKFIEENMTSVNSTKVELYQVDDIIVENSSAVRTEKPFDSVKYVEQLLEKCNG